MKQLEPPRSNDLSNVLKRIKPRVLRGRPVRQYSSVLLREAYRSGFIGCVVDDSTLPKWCRKIARHEHDRFKAEVTRVPASDVIPEHVRGEGRGKRACNWNYSMKLDAKAFTGYQNYGNCTAASLGWTILTQIAGYLILAKKARAEYLARYGTALIYSMRGWASQGMALSTAARAVMTVGTQMMVTYCDGKYDFTNEDADEKYGNQWGRSGPPKDLVEETKLLKAYDVNSATYDPDLIMDGLLAGGAFHTGSTFTASSPGDPVSGLERIGGHAQPIIGYDDTDEFRDFYREKTGKTLNEPVGIVDQSWGVDWLRMLNWPTHLWGPRPEGAFVLKFSNMRRLCEDLYFYHAQDLREPSDLVDWSLI